MRRMIGFMFTVLLAPITFPTRPEMAVLLRFPAGPVRPAGAGAEGGVPMDGWGGPGLTAG